MKKNIMMLIGYLTNGGAERSITNVANELSKYHNVILVVAGAKKIDYPCHVKIIELKSLRERNKLKAIHELKKLKKEYKIDVTISYTTVYNFYNVMSKYKDKTIISIRNHLSTKHEKRRDRIMHRISIKLAQKIVCCSQSVYYDQLNNYHANPKKLLVIQNFCNLDGIISDMGCAIKECDMHLVNDHLIVTMARLVPHKGHKHIMKAMSLVVKEIPDAHLLIFSRGPLREELEEFSKKLHLENNVFFMDFHPNPYQFIKLAKAFILASDYEGFPNVLIEAMACGAPIIATDAPGGSREIVSNTVSKGEFVNDLTEMDYGILIPSFINEHDSSDITEHEKMLARAFIMLLSDDNKYHYYHNKSLERTDTFARDKILKKWLDVIGE